MAVTELVDTLPETVTLLLLRLTVFSSEGDTETENDREEYGLL